MIFFAKAQNKEVIGNFKDNTINEKKKRENTWGSMDKWNKISVE